MKSYNHLMEQLIDADNIKCAIQNAGNAKIFKRDNKAIRKYCDRDKYVDYYRDLAYNYTAKVKEPIEIYDGISRKKRKIIVPTFDEQVLCHMIIQVLEPIIRKSMYRYTYGSLPHRGGVQGKNTIKRWLKRDKKNTKFFLKMDIKNFFGSVNLDKMIDFIKSKIHDFYFVRLISEILKCSIIGLALGYYTSHWFAHWYLQRLDFYIKQELHTEYYIRYVDDMVCWSNSKEKLHQIVDLVNKKLKELGLKLKENWIIRRIIYEKNKKEYGQFVDFMGYRFYRNKITLRKAIMIKMTQKARKVANKRRATIFDCQQMVSALNWIEQTDIYNMYKDKIKPYIDFGKMKKYISFYNKRKAKEDKLIVCF